MAVRSLNKNGYGEQWDMPGYVASGSTSQINPDAVYDPTYSGRYTDRTSAVAMPEQKGWWDRFTSGPAFKGSLLQTGGYGGLRSQMESAEQKWNAANLASNNTGRTTAYQNFIDQNDLVQDAIRRIANQNTLSGNNAISGDVVLQKAEEGEPTILPTDAIRNIASGGGVPSNLQQRPWSTAIDMGGMNMSGKAGDSKGGMPTDKIFDAQGNFISDSIQAEGAKAGQLRSPDYKKRFKAQTDIEDTYLFQNAPSNIVNPDTGMRWSLTMKDGKDKRAQEDAEDKWLENARRYRLGTPGATEFMPGSELAAPKKEVQPILQSEIQGLSPEEIEMMFPGGQVPTDAGTSYAPSGTPRIATELTDDKILQAQEDGEPITLPDLDVTTDTTTTDGDGTPMPPIPPMPGAGGLPGTDMDGTSIQGQWGSQELQDAWATVQSGQGVPNWAIRTVQVPYRTLDPETGGIVTINRTEISPETQLLLQENARIEGMRQSAEGRRLGQYQTILQNPRAAAAMRVMEQMGLGGISQLLGTPQPQQITPSMEFQGLTPGMEEGLGMFAGDPGSQFPQGMTPEQLRLRQMWGGENIPTTGFLSGADPERLAISQALQQIAGFSPEQTRMSAFGVTPGVTPSYQVPRLLAMRR